MASCAYNYAHRLVWIEDLREEDDPSFYDLCEDHAARLRVMNGWTLDDRRTQLATSQASLLQG